MTKGLNVHFYFTVFLFILVFGPRSLQSQVNSVSQGEMQYQSRFISAEKARILGNLEEAEEILKELAGDLPEVGAVRYELARVYDMQDKGSEALESIAEAIELEGDNPWYLQMQANIATRMERFALAAGTYERLTGLRPERSNYYLSWAYSLLRDDRRQEAISVLDGLEKRIGIQEEISHRKHQIYDGDGEKEKAARELKKLADAYPLHLDYRMMYANYLKESGREQEAIEVLEETARAYPDELEVQLALAGLRSVEDMPEDEFSGWKSQFRDPDIDPDVKIRRMIPYLQRYSESPDTGMARNLFELVEIIESVHGPSAKTHAMRGDIHFHAGRPDEAVGQYGQSIALRDDVYQVWEQLMSALAATGRYGDLRERSEDAIDLYPNKAGAYFMNALALYSLEKYAGSNTMLERAEVIAGRDKHLKARIYALKGDIHYELGEMKKALEYWTLSAGTGIRLPGIDEKINSIEN